MENRKMTKELVIETVHSALDRLFSSEDVWLLQDNANERSISFRLAGHLEQEMKDRGGEWAGLHVDCEYNRDVSSPKPPYSKRLNLPERYDVSNEDTHATTVFPDVIVHRRRSDTNCVVIEIKKAGGNPAAEAFDVERKLPAYLVELDYKFGVFIVLGIGAEAGTIRELAILERTADEIIHTKYA